MRSLIFISFPRVGSLGRGGSARAPASLPPSAAALRGPGAPAPARPCRRVRRLPGPAGRGPPAAARPARPGLGGRQDAGGLSFLGGASRRRQTNKRPAAARGAATGAPLPWAPRRVCWGGRAGWRRGRGWMCKVPSYLCPPTPRHPRPQPRATSTPISLFHPAPTPSHPAPSTLSDPHSSLGKCSFWPGRPSSLSQALASGKRCGAVCPGGRVRPCWAHPPPC